VTVTGRATAANGGRPASIVVRSVTVTGRAVAVAIAFAAATVTTPGEKVSGAAAAVVGATPAVSD
jgi:ABC-type Fe2+-enterobactin transport system substrate-binding protein